MSMPIHLQMAIGLSIPNYFTMVDIYAYNKNQESKTK